MPSLIQRGQSIARPYLLFVQEPPGEYTVTNYRREFVGIISYRIV